MGYHEGELAVQRRAGVIDRAYGAEAELPELARDFLEGQLWIVLGAEDTGGRVWATVLYGWPGFISAPRADTVVIAAEPLVGDPLTGALDGPVGGLAIEPGTRRRLRLNGRATSGADGITLALDEVYGNCPKYITARDVEAVAALDTPPARAVGDELDARALQLLAAADTAFVATRGPDGLDVSHRGGRPGFLHVADSRTIVWPDYPGNRMFNTLGNLAVDGRCGLTIVDPEDGTTLYVSGRAEILWDEARAVQLRVEAVVRLDRAAPLRWRFERAARNPPLA